METARPGRAKGRWLLWGSSLALLGVLGVGVAGYLRYAEDVPNLVPPLPSPPRPNGYERALQAFSRSARHVRRPSPRWPDGAPAQLRAALAPVRPGLDQVRAAFRLTWRVPGVPAPEVTLPQKALFQACGRCFLAESNLALQEGDAAGAMQRTLDALELAALAQTGDCFAGRKAAAALHAEAMGRTARLVPLLGSGAAEAALARVRRIQGEWSAPEETVKNERIATLTGITQALRTLPRESFAERWEVLKQSGRGSAWMAVAQGLLPRRVCLSNVDAYYQQLLEESRKPTRRRVPVPVPGDPWSAFLFGPEPIEDLVEIELPRTDLALLETALAVQLHRMRAGRYPATLAQVDRRWLPQPPRDLWDQPLRYTLREGRPLIYSLYHDGQDDGGRPIDPRLPLSRARGDLVFGRFTPRGNGAFRRPGGSSALRLLLSP